MILPLVSERGPDRIDLWLRMLEGQEVDIRGDGYAPHNVSMAVGKAGWKGVGWKATSREGSLHDKKFIPHLTAHNDFIFAVIAEELGFRGALLLLGGFALLADSRIVYRILQSRCVWTPDRLHGGCAIVRPYL